MSRIYQFLNKVYNVIYALCCACHDCWARIAQGIHFFVGLCHVFFCKINWVFACFCSVRDNFIVYICIVANVFDIIASVF